MLKSVFSFVVAMAVGGLAQGVHAQETMLEACAAEIPEYCSEVQPGDGRLSACLYAHTDLLGDQCFAATAVSSLILERLFDRIQIVSESCEADIQSFCSAEPAGGGRVYACLKDNRSNLQPTCAAGLGDGD